MLPFMFATGIENSAPTIADGRIRRDQMEECGHYRLWQTDFALVAHLGVRTLRYGVPLHRTWLGPDRYDWAFADQAFGTLQRLGIDPVADLCHFCVPDWVGNFQNPDFPALFQGYARAFATRYPWIRLYTPVNEMYVCAKFSALFGWWNEQARDFRSYVTALKHLARANVLAMHEIVTLRPDAVFIQSESSEYFHATHPGAVAEAERRNRLRFLSLDFNYGRPLEPVQREFVLAHGMTPDECRFFEDHALRDRCILGTDYYMTNEHDVEPDGTARDAGETLGYAMIAQEYAQRYGLPLMHTETNLDQGPRGDEAREWLRCQWAHVRGLMRSGVRVVGFTWFSLTVLMVWLHALRHERYDLHPVGLYDLDRRERAIGRAYRQLVARHRDLAAWETGAEEIARTA
jgi:beta-glucosidase/6-phospho-beta-glucosidase/beta-galactosidase